MLVVISDRIADFGLSAFGDCTAIYLCSAQPADYTAATTTLALGSKVGSRGEFFSFPGPQANGRQVIAFPVLTGLVERAGWLSRWAAVDQSTGTLLATGPISNPQFGNPGQRFNLPSWNILFNRGLGMVDFFDLPVPLSLSRGPTVLGAPSAIGNIALEPTGLTPAIPQLGVPTFRFPLQAANFKISTPLVFDRAASGQTHTLEAFDLVDGTPTITVIPTVIDTLSAVNFVGGMPIFGPLDIHADSDLETADTTNLTADLDDLSLTIVRSLTAVNLEVTGSIVISTSALVRINNLVAVNLSSGSIVIATIALGRISNLATANLRSGSPLFALASLNGIVTVHAANLTSGSPLFALAALAKPITPVTAANFAVSSPTVILRPAFTSS